MMKIATIVADGLYGQSSDFLDAADACVGVTTLGAIPADTRCWLQAPWTAEQGFRYKGGVRTKLVWGPPTPPRAPWRP